MKSEQLHVSATGGALVKVAGGYVAHGYLLWSDSTATNFAVTDITAKGAMNRLLELLTNRANQVIY